MCFKKVCLKLFCLWSVVFSSPAFCGIIDERAVLGDYDKVMKEVRRVPDVVPSSYPGVLSRTIVDRELTKAERQRNSNLETARNINNPIGAVREADGSYTLTDSVAIIRQNTNPSLNPLGNIAKENIVINGNVYGTVISLFDSQNIPGLTSIGQVK